MPPTYDLNKIKFATDAATFQRAVEKIFAKNGLFDECKEELGRGAWITLLQDKGALFEFSEPCHMVRKKLLIIGFLNGIFISEPI